MKKLTIASFLSYACMSQAGNYNVVVGNGNNVRGNGNNLFGNRDQIVGNQNTQIGDDSQIYGNGNYHEGNNQRIFGNDRYDVSEHPEQRSFENLFPSGLNYFYSAGTKQEQEIRQTDQQSGNDYKSIYPGQSGQTDEPTYWKNNLTVDEGRPTEQKETPEDQNQQTVYWPLTNDFPQIPNSRQYIQNKRQQIQNTIAQRMKPNVNWSTDWTYNSNQHQQVPFQSQKI